MSKNSTCTLFEIRSVWDKLPNELTDADIDEMKRLLDGTDIEIIGVASPFFKCDIDNAAERKEHLEILKGCIRTAKAFDTNLIRTFVFWDTGGNRGAVGRDYSCL